MVKFTLFIWSISVILLMQEMHGSIDRFADTLPREDRPFFVVVASPFGGNQVFVNLDTKASALCNFYTRRYFNRKAFGKISHDDIFLIVTNLAMDESSWWLLNKERTFRDSRIAPGTRIFITDKYWLNSSDCKWTIKIVTASPEENAAARLRYMLESSFLRQQKEKRRKAKTLRLHLLQREYCKQADQGLFHFEADPWRLSSIQCLEQAPIASDITVIPERAAAPSTDPLPVVW
jgi:hypothetical protein